MELFDAHAVSFISVTQAFNTTTSMGRLTLNMLLSFAQFEREITGERIRDKVAASKRKGIWMGGAVPLGYRVEDRALRVVEREAEFVRALYRRYLELGSVVRLKTALDSENVRCPSRMSRSGRTTGGVLISRGHLYWILSNPIYVGRLRHKGQIHDGLFRRSWTVRSGSRSSKGSPAKRRRGGRLSATIIPFLSASSMMTAETGWAPAMRLRVDGAGAIMCHARRCRDAGKSRIGRPHSSARDRESGCQRSRGSSRGAGKRDRRLSHRLRRRTWRLRDHAA